MAMVESGTQPCLIIGTIVMRVIESMHLEMRAVVLLDHFG